MDQTKDSGYTQLHELTQVYGELPIYVKQASVEETMSPQGLPSGQYADPVGTQFPGEP